MKSGFGFIWALCFGVIVWLISTHPLVLIYERLAQWGILFDVLGHRRPAALVAHFVSGVAVGWCGSAWSAWKLTAAALVLAIAEISITNFVVQTYASKLLFPSLGISLDVALSDYLLPIGTGIGAVCVGKLLLRRWVRTGTD